VESWRSFKYLSAQLFLKDTILSSVIEIIETLNQRLPELEYCLDELGKVQCSLLPRGLFRASQHEEWMTPGVCTEEIRADLKRLQHLYVTESNSAAVLFIAKQVGLKMHMLLHLCHLRRRKITAHHQTSFEMKQLLTRQQWLDTVLHERERLLQQQSALRLALDKNKESSHATLTLEHAIGDVEDQLASLQQVLSTLTTRVLYGLDRIVKG